MSGLYVHIPFCVKRCIYCDFFSTTQTAYKEDYIAALIREMEIKQETWQHRTFQTVYFGGGTPSLLTPKELNKIIEAIYHHFTISDHPEITLEANPDDLSDSYVSSLKAFPMNRISIGVQSFDDRELRFLNRRHTAQEAVDAVIRCKNNGFDNISIDLMYGLPEQTLADWSHTIDKAIEIDVSHISAYHLTCEEGTPVEQMIKNNEIKPVDEKKSAALFHLSVKKLKQAGYIHYEISNFARYTSGYLSGRISLHNASYWNGTYYLGLGASAHSYNGVSRSWNVSSVSGYINAVNEKSESLFETEWLDDRTRYNDYIITRLRTIWGVSINELRQMFGKDREQHFLEKSADLICRKKLIMKGDNVKVSLNGIFISDAIMRELIVL